MSNTPGSYSAFQNLKQKSFLLTWKDGVFFFLAAEDALLHLLLANKVFVSVNLGVALHLMKEDSALLEIDLCSVKL